MTEGSLAVLVNTIRGAIGKSPDGTDWIRTVHGFGYAFDGAVGEVREGAPATHRQVVFSGTQDMELSEGSNLMARCSFFTAARTTDDVTSDSAFRDLLSAFAAP